MEIPSSRKAFPNKKYPLSNILIYYTATVLQLILGGTGIIIGYSFFPWIGLIISWLYLAFTFMEMSLFMPKNVCPNSSYYAPDGPLCVSGLNILSRKTSPNGDKTGGESRAKGNFCPNYLYILSLFFPVVLIIPALIINFSVLMMSLWLSVAGLPIFRFFYCFPPECSVFFAA